MRRRALALLLLLGVVLASACGRKAAFQGQMLDPPRPPLDFTLPDQSGHALTLSALHGQVVVLTFLYTTCPDVCPLVTAKLHEVSDLLGKSRSQVAMVAVTVDPERDTGTAVTEYSRRWSMLDRWRFLVGTQAQLDPIWEFYWVGQVRRELPGSSNKQPQYAVGHGSPVHLFDRAGLVRVVFDADFRPAAMAHDIEILLTQ